MLEIRKATCQDNKAIARILGELITSYYNDIKIIGAITMELESNVLSPNSILFYENCNIFEKNNEIMGVVSFYDGHLDKFLTQNLADLTNKYDDIENQTHLQFKTTSPRNNIIPQGLYLSMISVLPKYQGLKIGQQLIKSVEYEAKRLGYDCVSIKVDMRNYRAEELYRRLGYNYINEYLEDGVVLKYFEKIIY